MSVAVEGPSKGSRFANWLIFSVGFSLFPLAASTFLTAMGKSSSTPGTVCAEVLFFALGLAATSLGDLRHVPRPLKDVWLTILNGILVVIGSSAAFLYGCLLISSSGNKPDLLFQANLLRPAELIAVPAFLLAGAAQYFLLSTDRVKESG